MRRLMHTILGRPAATQFRSWVVNKSVVPWASSSPNDALHAIDPDLRRVDPLAAASLATAKADAHAHAEAAIIAGSDTPPS
jgi:hypothetical protein